LPILYVGFAAANAAQLSYRTLPKNTGQSGPTVPVDPQLAASTKAYPSVLPSPVESIGMLQRGEPPPTQEVVLLEGSQRY
jgi:hypothetical protein